MTDADTFDPDHTRSEDVYMRGVLKSGLRVIIRPLRPTDRQTVADGYSLMSDRNRYLRFLGGSKGPRLSEATLDAIVDQVDHHEHEALLMLWPRTSRADIGLGLGEFFRLPNDPEVADVAVTMIDQAHGLGGGRLLITALARRAREVGITTFTATIAASNDPSYRMMAGVGTVIRDELEGGIRELDVRLPDPTSS